MGREIRTGRKNTGREKEANNKKINTKKKSNISDLSIQRLLLYSNYFNFLKTNKIKSIQSIKIANFFGFDSAQVRKDLSYVGKFGKRGCGYNVNSLKNGLDKFLYKSNSINTIVVGIGNLGSALLGYKIFKKMGISIVSGFDINKNIIGTRINKIPIYNINNLIRISKKNNVDIGVITTPAEYAEETFQLMINAGIKCIINFAPYHLTSKKVLIKNIDLSIFFEILRYELFKNN